MVDFFISLNFLSCRVVVQSGGLVRARFNTRPYKEMSTAAVRRFLRESPLEDLVAFARQVDSELEGKGFDHVEKRTLTLLQDLMALASKEGVHFLEAVKTFLTAD